MNVFQKLPTGSVPLYGAKPPDVSQFKRKQRHANESRSNLAKISESIMNFLSTTASVLKEHNIDAHLYFSSVEFHDRVEGILNPKPTDPTPVIPSNYIRNFSYILVPTLSTEQLQAARESRGQLMTKLSTISQFFTSTQSTLSSNHQNGMSKLDPSILTEKYAAQLAPEIQIDEDSPVRKPQAQLDLSEHEEASEGKAVILDSNSPETRSKDELDGA
jgi:hypothetical protein